MFIVSLPFAVLRGGYWAIIAMVGIAHICCYTGKVCVMDPASIRLCNVIQFSTDESFLFKCKIIDFGALFV